MEKMKHEKNGKDLLPMDMDLPKEGELTKQVEMVTAKVPSMAYLGMAVGSMALSVGIALFSRRKNAANFVGLWVPTFLLLGIYNKLVKVLPTEDAA